MSISKASNSTHADTAINGMNKMMTNTFVGKGRGSVADIVVNSFVTNNFKYQTNDDLRKIKKKKNLSMSHTQFLNKIEGLR